MYLISERELEVTWALLSFKIEWVKTVIAAILGVMGKKINKANKDDFGLNNLCIYLWIQEPFSTIFKSAACSVSLDLKLLVWPVVPSKNLWSFP